MFQLTDDDVIYLALGTAAQGAFQYFMRKEYSAVYPSIASTVAVGGVALGLGYKGVSENNYRKMAAFLFGFGMSQVISYLLPRITGGADQPTRLPLVP